MNFKLIGPMFELVILFTAQPRTSYACSGCFSVLVESNMTMLAASANSGLDPKLPVPGLGVSTDLYRLPELPPDPKAKKRKKNEKQNQKNSKKVGKWNCHHLFDAVCMAV